MWGELSEIEGVSSRGTGDEGPGSRGMKLKMFGEAQRGTGKREL